MKKMILLSLLFSLSAQATCFIDGSNTPRCFEFKDKQTPGAFEGSSYTVFTADTPEKVLLEQDRMYFADVYTPWIPRAAQPDIKVLKIPMGVGKDYPDVICLVFKSGGQTCFDTMEITER